MRAIRWLPWWHGGLPHAGRPLREARRGDTRLAGHHTLLLEPCPPLFFKLLLDFVDLFCQQVVVLSPTIGRLIHVSLNFSSISHQILHPSVLQCSWVRSREDSLHKLVDKVVTEVLRDVFMPRLPNACCRRRTGCGHGAQVTHTIIH